MAYLSKEQTKEIRNNLKKAFPGWKFSVVNDGFIALNVSIMKAPIRFTDENYSQINHFHPHLYKNEEVLKKIIAICNEKNYDNSNSQIDYFDVGYYFSLSQGKWDRPFILVEN